MFEIDDEVVFVVRQWVQKAENDLKNAAHTLKLGVDGPTDTVCFHAQQCVEKYVKAKAAAQKALELDEKLAEAHTALGAIPSVLRLHRRPQRSHDLVGFVTASDGFRASAVKRLFDVLGAALLVLLLSPVLLVTALLVRARLGSPVIFGQQRPGRDGRLFTLYKFRSMLSAPTGTDTVSAVGTDADRLTPFGRALRASSLDELPELFNVVIQSEHLQFMFQVGEEDICLLGFAPGPAADENLTFLCRLFLFTGCSLHSRSP